MTNEDNSTKRRAVEPAVDNRSSIDMEELKTFIIDQNNELRDNINKKIQEAIDEKLNHFAGYVDSRIQRVQDDCMATINGLSEEVTDKIRNFSNDIEDRIDFLERQAKLCDVVIKNVPYRPNESMENFVFGICEAIEYNNTNGIKSAFRLTRNQNKSNPIIMKFYELADKRDFMYAYFQKQKLNLTDLGFKTKLRIVICEALTPKNNEIFRKAMDLKFKKIFSSVSTKNGLVYYRLDQKSQPSKISSLSSLNAFYSTGAEKNEIGTDDRQAKDKEIDQTSQSSSTLHNAGDDNVAQKLDQPMVEPTMPNNETISEN